MKFIINSLRSIRFLGIALALLLLSFFSVGEASAATPPIRLDNISIVVGSCDKYEDCWRPFFALLFQRWPSLLTTNAHIPIFLITDDKTFEDSRYPGRITVIQTHNKPWSDGMVEALQKVPTDYVISMQEDYFLMLNVDEARLAELLPFCQKYNVTFVELNPDKIYDKLPVGGIYAVGEKPLRKRYHKVEQPERRITLQTVLWNKADFLSFLVPGEGPWAFEFNASERSRSLGKPVLALLNQFPFVFLNGCEKGAWRQNVLEYLQSLGIMGTPQLPVKDDLPSA